MGSGGVSGRKRRVAVVVGGIGRSSAAMQRGRQEAQSFSEDGIQM